MKIGTQDIKITHSDKVLFPKSGMTKGNLIGYYEKIADHMLPYLRDRPLTLHRFPKGILGEGFFQKNASDYFPDWIRTAKVKKKDDWVNHVICETMETLVYLVNQGAITFQIPLSKIDKLDFPCKLIFDLDPPIDLLSLLLGEASHGTYNKYTWITTITKPLTLEYGFNFIVVKGD